VPLVTIALVLANIVVYLLEVRHGGSFFGGPSAQTAVRYGAIPYELANPGRHCELAGHLALSGRPGPIICQGQANVTGTPAPQPATAFTVLSSMFLHGSFLHVFGNMLFLAIFGPHVEDSMSRPRFLVFYLLGGVLALAVQVAVAPGSTSPTLGASGAVAAVLGGYALLYPRARVVTLIFIIFLFTIVELPALVLLALWFLVQLWFELAGLTSPLGGSEGVAYLAHVGAFLFGLLAIHAFVARRKALPGAGPGAARLS
jgi:membrane associated rhomboid family serine protease